MDVLESKGALGSFRLSEGVVSTIVATSATEVAGVAGMAVFGVTLKNVLAKDQAQRSTKIKMNEGAVGIDLCVDMLMGANLKEVAEAVQKNVKSAVENMTGLVVSRINVVIAGIKAEKASAQEVVENTKKTDEEKGN